MRRSAFRHANGGSKLAADVGYKPSRTDTTQCSTKRPLVRVASSFSLFLYLSIYLFISFALPFTQRVVPLLYLPSNTRP